jgi:hypothetical protein
VNAIDGAPFDITDENITDLSSLAAEFGFAQLLSQIEARGPRFSAARPATWDREDIHQLVASLPDATAPDIQILHLSRSMQELTAHRSAETPQTRHSTAAHESVTNRARPDETETRLQEKRLKM